MDIKFCVEEAAETIGLDVNISSFLFFYPDYNPGDFVKLEDSELGQGDA